MLRYELVFQVIDLHFCPARVDLSCSQFQVDQTLLNFTSRLNLTIISVEGTELTVVNTGETTWYSCILKINSFSGCNN
jgi:hypothetical protein